MFPMHAAWLEAASPVLDPFGLIRATQDYWQDTFERNVLYWDVMRRRGNQYLDHMAQTKPNVLGFEAEVLMDGRDLPRPVNYELMRILPPADTMIDPLKRPFVIVDPRAGHGPGIGGFKPDSEIGVALRAGHPCYFIGFLPFPVPGQHVEDVVDAEIAFMRAVGARHAEANEKPVVIGNCQAGWQLMMAAALEPDAFGPILVAGAPLSYWAGERGRYPMRYTGGLLGGSWLTALAGDLGAGLFDGAWLVQNFERLNPANTLWSKQYRLYANVDDESERYLQFERWWGGHIVLNAEEIQYIVDNLFIGNRLSTAQLITRDGRRIDLRNVRSPIVVFCSQGDNITPPPQALGWVSDLYDGVDDIVANEQTIVYCVHDSTGHLGIFVSGSISRREHAEFTANMDYIDVLPPGLYETAITPRDATEDATDGDYLLEFRPRGVDDLQSLVQRRDDDERRFATVARLSESGLALYQQYTQPWLQAVMTPEAGRWMRRLHPIRLGYKLLSDRNPLMSTVPVLAERIRRQRQPLAQNNPLAQWERSVATRIEENLEAYGEWRDRASEALFMTVYGQPWLQALAGIGPDMARVRPHPGHAPEHQHFLRTRRAALRERIASGGAREAVVRALIYILGGASATDERNFQRLKATREELGKSLDLQQFKMLVREQFFILKLDVREALEALPTLIARDDATQVDTCLAHITHILDASEPQSDRVQKRLERVRALFEKARPAALDHEAPRA
ncbi:uncharacterized protein DUF3141 [Chromohalobacter marismortui]|uniref:Uncharacterized protein DUF3141 n=1 Tax=Chromohalobacter marismortui TaxID=42055 RepID=A0A4R7NVG8_9GAMM|nr:MULTISPECIES: DUF3141 domain-containing protein [Chromohalobacter]MCI0510416.1 DUF3141 domain-containing protein [Chromohalobacter sp.]MCI0594670.1 DUF3141 domain-containing protein [Chromohalobacter sp.]TDU25008.1 uncharacterized protein DUF3141 [Chromohalobacter marismortui]